MERASDHPTAKDIRRPIFSRTTSGAYKSRQAICAVKRTVGWLITDQVTPEQTIGTAVYKQELV